MSKRMLKEKNLKAVYACGQLDDAQPQLDDKISYVDLRIALQL